MKVLVFGSGGQLGEELRRVAGSNVGYVFLSHSDVDICDEASVRSVIGREGPGFVVNCAAYTNVDKAESDVDSADMVNRVACGVLASVCKEYGCVLVHVSTDYVFGGDSCVPYVEDDVKRPLCVYGRTKSEGEELIISSGCRHVIIRTSWLYSSHHKNFLTTMCSLMGSGRDVRVVFDQVGTPTWARDLAEAIVCVVERYRDGVDGVYHYSNEGVASWYDFAHAIRDLRGYDVNVSPCRSYEWKSVVSRPSYSVLDKSKVREVFSVDVPYWRNSLSMCLGEID